MIATFLMGTVLAVAGPFSDWPEGLDPKSVGGRVIAQFRTTEPEAYAPKGFDGDEPCGLGKWVCYAVASLWVNALEFAHATDDAVLERSLVESLEPFLPGGRKADKVTKPRHVDFNVFGAVPLEAAILTGRKDFLRLGIGYADDQWMEPRPDDLAVFPKWLVPHYVPAEKQRAYLKDGYSGQTRLWIDDMYMINLLQTQAFRATRDRKYILRAAREMRLYLDKLQLEDGLFNHAADVPFRWGRGNGWMAAGMPLVLRYLKPDDADYAPILAGYRKMMATLLRHQRASGLWGQLVDDPKSWDETSGSLMFAYGFIMGCKFGWLDRSSYGPAARKAYLAVAASLDEYGNVPNVCMGTGARNSREYYYARKRLNGDPHGQAPLLWCCVALLAPEGDGVGRSSAAVRAEKPHDNPPEGFPLTAWQSARLPPPLDVRKVQVAAVEEGVLRLVPTFVSCSVVWGAAKPVDGIAVEYRQTGGTWKRAEKFIHFAEVGNYRTSIFALAEDTDYEARVVAGGKTLASGSFRTWTSEVKVAKTIVIDPKTATYPIRIGEQGSPDGWIRYTTKPGAVIGGKDCMTSVLEVEGAKFVLIDNVTIEGGGGWGRSPIRILKSRGVRVRNCELSGWGRVGEFVYAAKGRGAACELKPKVHEINYDCAIAIEPQTSEVVVERCYIHDARSRSNAWYYSHPSGTEGIVVDHVDYGVVLRWNDIVGSDFHRYNDCVESYNNFHADGAFNRDADIYGNFLIFANDDCIELDGGMQNVRCFQNRFESAVSQVSIQGCCTSPVYLYDNLFAHGCDEFGMAFPCIKTSGFDPYWYAPYAMISGNRICQDGWKPTLGPTSRWDCRDDNVVNGGEVSQKWATGYPVRDLPFVLDTGIIRGVEVSGSPVTRTFKAIASKPQRYRVRQNLDSDWFEVLPREGVLKPGENTFTVTIRPERMAGRRHWRAAFLLRTPAGLSRCVSLYAENVGFRTPDEPVPPSARTLYAKDVKPDGGTYSFDIAEEGDYHFFVKASRVGPGKFPRILASVDGAEAKESIMWMDPALEVWTLVRPGNTGHCGSPACLEPFHLKPGRHTLTLSPSKSVTKAHITGVAVSDRCLEFEAH